jgi:nucleoid DNA-binding protein
VNLSPVIRELLLHKEKLVIPEFGTFSVIHHPAEISTKTNLLIPPSKEIVFDPAVKSGDDALAELIMKRHSLSREKALEAIGVFIQLTEDQVTSSGSALIEGLGTLTRNDAGNMTFKPVTGLGNLTGAFGLPTINIPLPRAVHKPPPSRKTKRWWIPAAVVVIAAGLFLVLQYTTLLDFVTGGKGLENIFTGNKEEPERIIFGNRVTGDRDTALDAVSQQIDEHTAREKALLYEEGKDDPVAMKPAPQPETRTITVPETKTPVEKNLAVEAGKYHIIAGSFQVEENARKQKIRLENKGLSPVLLPPRGRFYMVSLGAFNTREEAGVVLEQLRESMEQEFWVMKIR